ncbi:hypothetical protein CKAH01_00546 [Colletotrichum kahawae]|uniref:Uncharacterized protein n=1 Tax=Colletotrichum kahawae TaxID=34407 RepID=A0AAE0D788_COLKA|nr:hypothetical protein CKAH01_00546 [Colletotrichum kahawae]
MNIRDVANPAAVAGLAGSSGALQDAKRVDMNRPRALRQQTTTSRDSIPRGMRRPQASEVPGPPSWVSRYIEASHSCPSLSLYQRRRTETTREAQTSTMAHGTPTKQRGRRRVLTADDGPRSMRP